MQKKSVKASKLLFHSDQGRNYTAKAFRDCLISLGIQQSFSKKAVPYYKC